MKSALRTVAASTIVCSLTAASFAIPYASQIKAHDTTIDPGSGTRISYVLSESADAVTVSLIDDATTVATFPGPVAQGFNTIDWNGTNDNATGAAITGGKLRVTVTATGSHTTWSEIAGNGSTALIPPLGTVHRQLFSGFSPNDCLFVTDRNSDFFGIGITAVSHSAPGVAAAIAIQADSSSLDGSDGYASRIFRVTELESTAINTTLWGMSNDPDNDNMFYFTGQSDTSGMRFFRGDLTSSETLASADPNNFLSGLPPRAVKVAREGNAKYMYICCGINLYKAPMDPVSNTVTATPVRITDFASPNRYARGIDIDAAGNIYFVSKHLSSGKNGALFRWTADDAAGPTPMLSEALASWNISCPDTMLNMMGPAISPQGDVYVAMVSGGVFGKQSGIFSVGNTATDTLHKTLSPSDCVVDFAAVGNPPSIWNANTLTFSVRSDPAGNILAVDRNAQQIRMYSPPGNFTVPITAPPSQTIRVGSGVAKWMLY